MLILKYQLVKLLKYNVQTYITPLIVAALNNAHTLLHFNGTIK